MLAQASVDMLAQASVDMLAQASVGIGCGRAFALYEALDQTGALIGPLLVAAAIAVFGALALVLRGACRAAAARCSCWRACAWRPRARTGTSTARRRPAPSGERARTPLPRRFCSTPSLPR